MINKREIVILVTSALILGYIIKFPEFKTEVWLLISLLALIILGVNTFGKKLTARFYDSNAVINHWNLGRYGLGKTAVFKKPFPMWVFTPIIIAFITLPMYTIKWLAVTTFDASPLPSKAKRKFSEVTEWDLALIAIGGILFNLILAFISHLLGFGYFAKLNVLFAIFNLIPISQLDGAKIFFGSRILWISGIILTLAILVLLDISGIIAIIVIALLIAAAVISLFYSLVEI